MKLGAMLNEMDTVMEIRKALLILNPFTQTNGKTTGYNTHHGDADKARGNQTIFVDESIDTNLPAGFELGFLTHKESNIEGVDYMSQTLDSRGLGYISRWSNDGGETWTVWAV